MARTAITVNRASAPETEIDSLTTTAGDAANNHSMVNDGRTMLIIDNAGGGVATATIKSVASRYGRTGDLTVAVPAGEIAYVPLLPPSRWNASGGVVDIDLDVDTSVRLAAIVIAEPHSN